MNIYNYKYLSALEFAEIIQGEKSSYIIPQTANARASWQETNQVLREAGIEPQDSVMIPTSYERYTAKWQYGIQSSWPKDHWPDFDDPLVYVIKETVNIYHGLIYSTGVKQKTELVHGVNLSNCQFNGDFILNSVRSKRELLLTKCNFQQDYLNPTSTTGGRFNISNSSFKSINLNGIYSTDANKEIAFPKPAILLQEIKFDDLSAEDLIIEDCLVQVLIINCTKNLIRKISINNCHLNEIKIIGNQFDEIEIKNLQGNPNIYINAEITKFTLEGQCINSENSDQNIFCNSVKIEYKIQGNKGNYTIKNLFIKSLLFLGNNNNDILLKNSKIIKLELTDFSNTGQMRLNNINHTEYLIIKHSSLGKAELLNLNLFNASHAQIIHSNLSEVVLINTNFPNNLIGESEKDYAGIREAFRQLKYAASKQADRISELTYEASEMSAYTKDPFTPKSRTDRFILRTNQYSNNHGKDASRAFFWLLGLTLIMFSSIKLCQGQYLDFKEAFKTISEYLNFAFNPLHDYYKVFNIDSSHPHTINDGAILLDTLTRLIAGYLIFQFLRAFRKYVK
ncbi:hypothetical protein HNV11_09650 [Spirosoma taeanense]|uniref:Uncharacterized protein n=1 Tax=Spirosoma taeanense TaxID=2735870 RepID=A0A6M5Y557_9BACT|nr:hypothetical protein [Spirosoma taeanense]QJW89627.1 hypothetical protein HNV11_09650 [Spirosoma taeanense]